jgi:hypothetical protein
VMREFQKCAAHCDSALVQRRQPEGTVCQLALSTPILLGAASHSARCFNKKARLLDHNHYSVMMVQSTSHILHWQVALLMLHANCFLAANPHQPKHHNIIIDSAPRAEDTHAQHVQGPQLAQRATSKKVPNTTNTAQQPVGVCPTGETNWVLQAPWYP